jgi:hypothetical protein
MHRVRDGSQDAEVEATKDAAVAVDAVREAVVATAIEAAAATDPIDVIGERPADAPGNEVVNAEPNAQGIAAIARQAVLVPNRPLLGVNRPEPWNSLTRTMVSETD